MACAPMSAPTRTASSSRLHGSTPRYIGVERRVLAPFDVIEPIDRRSRPRFVRAPGVGGEPAAPRCRRIAARRSAVAAPCADRSPAASARAGAGDSSRGLGSRVLLADEVGLGKTIQAALVVAEMLARGAIDRVLVLTPAGLRDQWADELVDAFRHRRARLVDAPDAASRWRRRCRSASIRGPPRPIAIASIDYVKRPEVLPAVAACRGTSSSWTKRTASPATPIGIGGRQQLAARAAYVLLLTATPHSGDRRAFASLCDSDRVDADRSSGVPPTRHADVGIGAPRRVHIVRRPAERRRAADARAALRGYAGGSAVRTDRGPRRVWLALVRSPQARAVERLVARAVGRTPARVAAGRSARQRVPGTS